MAGVSGVSTSDGQVDGSLDNEPSQADMIFKSDMTDLYLSMKLY